MSPSAPDFPRPVRLQYPNGLEELGIAVDANTAEGSDRALLLGRGDLIEVDGVPRRVAGVTKNLATGRPGIEGPDVSVRIDHRDPDEREEPPKRRPNPLNNPRGIPPRKDRDE